MSAGDETEAPSAARGRRPDLTKRRAVLEAARSMFLAQGFGVSMDAIAAAAKVSKQTIYKAFATKEELFAAIIADSSSSLSKPLADHPKGVGPVVVLHDYARHMLEVLLSPERLALRRLLIAERGQFPDLVAAFFRHGPAQTLARLGAYLEEQSRVGSLWVAEPMLAAEVFIGMVIATQLFRAELNVGPPPEPEETRRRINHAVDAFMRAYETKYKEPTNWVDGIAPLPDRPGTWTGIRIVVPDEPVKRPRKKR